MLTKKSILISGALFGGLGVALGAFGAHAFKQTLLENNSIATYTLATQYHMYHALALLLIGVLMNNGTASKAFGVSGLCMALGIILFSGSLYVLSLTGIHGGLVFLTPLGGVFFLAGWISLLIGVIRK